MRCLFGGHSKRGDAVALEVSVGLLQFLTPCLSVLLREMLCPFQDSSPALCQHSHLNPCMRVLSDIWGH